MNTKEELEKKYPRLMIKEELLLHSDVICDIMDDPISLIEFIKRLESLHKNCDDVMIKTNAFDNLDSYKIVERSETDKEYGTRIGKIKSDYQKYLKLKEQFEGK